MATLKQMVPECRTHLSSVPQDTVILYLRRASKQFCQDSKKWDVEIGSATITPLDNPYVDLEIPVPSIGGETDYVLPAGSYINSISRLWLDDMKKCPIDGEYYAYREADGVLELNQSILSQSQVLHIAAILEPTKAANSIPDWMFEKWSDAIVDYAIYEIMMMPGKDWYDPDLAGTFWRKYQGRVSEATTSKARGNTRKRIRMPVKEFN